MSASESVIKSRTIDALHIMHNLQGIAADVVIEAVTKHGWFDVESQTHYSFTVDEIRSITKAVHRQTRYTNPRKTKLWVNPIPKYISHTDAFRMEKRALAQ